MLGLCSDAGEKGTGEENEFIGRVELRGESGDERRGAVAH